jgi:hypothetical protein
MDAQWWQWAKTTKKQLAVWVKKFGHDTKWAEWAKKKYTKSNWLNEWKRLKCKNVTNDTTQSGLSELKKNTQKNNWLGEFWKTFTEDQCFGFENVGELNIQNSYPLLIVLKIMASQMLYNMDNFEIKFFNMKSKSSISIKHLTISRIYIVGWKN